MNEEWLVELIGPCPRGGVPRGPGIARVLWLRYCASERWTLAAIGQDIERTHEAVRQRVALGIRLLRHPSRHAAFVAAVPRDHPLAAATFYRRGELAAAYDKEAPGGG